MERVLYEAFPSAHILILVLDASQQMPLENILTDATRVALHHPPAPQATHLTVAYRNTPDGRLSWSSGRRWRSRCRRWWKKSGRGSASSSKQRKYSFTSSISLTLSPSSTGPKCPSCPPPPPRMCAHNARLRSIQNVQSLVSVEKMSSSQTDVLDLHTLSTSRTITFSVEQLHFQLFAEKMLSISCLFTCKLTLKEMESKTFHIRQ